MAPSDNVVPEPDVQKLVDRLTAQKGIKITYNKIDGANHFFDKREAEVVETVKEYVSNMMSKPREAQRFFCSVTRLAVIPGDPVKAVRPSSISAGYRLVRRRWLSAATAASPVWPASPDKRSLRPPARRRSSQCFSAADIAIHTRFQHLHQHRIVPPSATDDPAFGGRRKMLARRAPARQR